MMIQGSNPGGGKRFFSSPKHVEGLQGPTQPPIRWVLGFFPRSKAARVWCWPL